MLKFMRAIYLAFKNVKLLLDNIQRLKFTIVIIGYGDNPGDVPETVRHGLMLLIAHWYENRENELMGTISKNLPYGFEALMDYERGSWYG